MKKQLLLIIMIMIAEIGFSQNPGFVYTGRMNPVIKKQKLNTSKEIDDIMPQFCRYFQLPYKEAILINQLSTNYFSKGYYINPSENYSQLIEYVSVDLTTYINGKPVTTKSKGSVLTQEQKNNLYAVDPGSEINVKIKFKSKSIASYASDNESEIKEGEYNVTALPETEAMFTGGNTKFSEYLNEHVFFKIPDNAGYEKAQMATVQFTIDEEGNVLNPKLIRSSSDSKIDKSIIDAISKMPKWIPAKGLLGNKVREVFIIPLGGGGC